MKHLYIISTHSHQNKMTTSNLATCLGPTVFRTEQECVSNLYNIKFYSEIIELLIVHHEHIFQPKLDDTFLKNLIPLKSPPTMMSGTSLHALNISGSAAVSPLLNTPLPPNPKLRLSSSNNAMNRRTSNHYEPTYRNALVNSSKTSVSSDSSQNSDRDQGHTAQISSPISSSSPTQLQSTNVSNHYSSNGFSSRLSVIPSHSSTNLNTNNNASLYSLSTSNNTGENTNASTIVNTSSQHQNKPYKPFNSQTGQFFQRSELDTSMNGLAKSASGSRTSTMFSSSNVSHVINNLSNMISTLTPNSTSNGAINKNLISSPLNTTSKDKCFYSKSSKKKFTHMFLKD